jgi:glycosyltransferase 2 family protein
MSKSKLNIKIIINRLILFIGFGVLIHIIFVLSTTERALLLHLNKLSIFHILLIMFLMLVPWLGYALRIKMWSKFLGEKIKFTEAIKIVVTAELASALSPTAVGGAPVKAALLLNMGFNSGNVGFMLTWGIIEDIIFYVSGIILALYFSQNLVVGILGSTAGFIANHQIIFLSVFITLLTFFILSKYKILPDSFKILHYLPGHYKQKLYSWREKFKLSISEMKVNFNKALAHGKFRMMAGFTILLIQWFSKFSVLAVLLYAFDIDFDVIQVYIRQWVVYVTMLFIPTPGASGGAEASFLLIFGKSIPSDISFLVVSLWRFFTYYYLLIAAVSIYSTISFTQKIDSEIEIETQD